MIHFKMYALIIRDIRNYITVHLKIRYKSNIFNILSEHRETCFKYGIPNLEEDRGGTFLRTVNCSTHHFIFSFCKGQKKTCTKNATYALRHFFQSEGFGGVLISKSRCPPMFINIRVTLNDWKR